MNRLQSSLCWGVPDRLASIQQKVRLQLGDLFLHKCLKNTKVKLWRRGSTWFSEDKHVVQFQHLRQTHIHIGAQLYAMGCLNVRALILPSLSKLRLNSPIVLCGGSMKSGRETKNKQ